MEVAEASAGAEEGTLDALAGHLKALANPKRLRLLAYLREPHYIEEIASELGVARQTAQAHVDQLVDIGVLQRVRGRRDTGPVTEFVVVPQRLFSIHEELGAVGLTFPDVDPMEDLRRLTEPLDGGGASPREKDLPRVTIVHGMRVGDTTGFTGDGPWLLGRDPAAAVSLDYDPFVSARHAEVRRGPDGFEVADLYSSNGTFVDWERLPRGGAHAVENGAIIRVGKTLLVFRAPR